MRLRCALSRSSLSKRLSVHFRTVTRYKLAEDATAVLANHLPSDAPRNLRMMFSRAVQTKESGPRLRIEKVEAETMAACSK